MFESGYAYHPSWGLVMSGGKREDTREDELNSVITTKNGREFEVLAPLPVNLTDHCLVIVDEDRLFVTGGETGRDRQKGAYVFSKSER